MNTLRSKGMAAAPYRPHRSPDWASERRWLRGDGSSAADHEVVGHLLLPLACLQMTTCSITDQGRRADIF